MDGIITEIDNNIFQNIKSISFAKYRQKMFNKMRNNKDSKRTFKKIFSASIINPKLKEINTKLGLKSKFSVKGNLYNTDLKRMNNTMAMLSKKLFMKKTGQSFYNKGMGKEDASTSLSSLIKTNTSFFNSSNLNFISERKKLSMNNIMSANINNNRNRNEIEKQYFFTFSFDKYIKDFLNDDKYYKNKFSCHKFLESVRIMRKSKLVNYIVNKKITDLKDIQIEEINNFKQLEFKIKIHQKFFYIYNDCLRHYLQELINIKRKEQEHLALLKSDIVNLKKEISKKNISINLIKEKLVNFNDLKKFLFEVKFGKTIDKIPIEIRKEYGFNSENTKEKEKEKEKKDNSSRKLSKSIMMNSDNFKRKFLSISQRKKTFKKSNLAIKSIQIINKPIFDSPEEFMNCFNLKTDKIRENLDLYWKNKTASNETKFKYRKVFKENERYMKNYLPEEERLLKLLTYQKKRNSILSSKLKYIIETNKTKQNSLKHIALKLKQTLLNIEAKLTLKNFVKEKYLELFFSNQDDFLSDINETIKITKYILKIIEMITEKLINNRNIFKNNKKLRDIYRKVHVDIERENNYNRYKLQISLASKKKEEKNKNVLNRIVKLRLGSVMKNRKKCYEEQIPEKLLLKRKLANKKVKKYMNIYEEQKDLFTFN